MTADRTGGDHRDLVGGALGQHTQEGAAMLNAANAIIEFIESTVARLRDSASRWSGALWTGPLLPCSP